MAIAEAAASVCADRFTGHSVVVHISRAGQLKSVCQIDKLATTAATAGRSSCKTLFHHVFPQASEAAYRKAVKEQQFWVARGPHPPLLAFIVDDRKPQRAPPPPKVLSSAVPLGFDQQVRLLNALASQLQIAESFDSRPHPASLHPVVGRHPKKPLPARTTPVKRGSRVAKVTKPIQYRLLTVQDVRDRYRKGVPIQFGTMQTFDAELGQTCSNVDLCATFVPDGTLHHENPHTGKREIIRDWLRTSTDGPYTLADSRNKHGSLDFYYLGGTRTGCNEGEDERLQVCSSPLNVLSEDCLDEINCWIKAD